jgi:hypothetical protein
MGSTRSRPDGIALFTSYRDKWPGDPVFDPVMAELNRRQAVVFVHPEAPLCRRGLLPGVHEHVVEYGFDTTRAITRILFSGTALLHRDIRWIFCHDGGTTPFLAERLVRAPGVNKSLAQYVPDGVIAQLQRSTTRRAGRSPDGAAGADPADADLAESCGAPISRSASAPSTCRVSPNSASAPMTCARLSARTRCGCCRAGGSW